MAKALLITGATGKQGGSVITALLKAEADFEIFALTRNTQSPSAQKLQQKSPNIKLVSGDLDDADAIFRKAKEITRLPIWGVYSVQVGSSRTPRFKNRTNLSPTGSHRRRSKRGKGRKARQSFGRCIHRERRYTLCILLS